MVKPKYYIQKISDPSTRYEILERDPVSGFTKLRGIRADFFDILDKKSLAKLNYKVVKEELPCAQNTVT